MEEITFELPIPPSVNNYWRFYRGRVTLTKEAREYKNAVKMLLRLPRMLTGRVAISISVFRPAKRGDLDNYFKVMLDALEGVLYENDRQVTEIHAFRYDDKENPRVHVVAWDDTDD